LIVEESASPRPPAMVAVAKAARRRHHDSILAVLLYGSCLRERAVVGKIVDLYLLADSYTTLYPNPVMRTVNRLLPPNVYYIEESFEGVQVAAKYAIVTLDQFEKLVSRRVLQPYFWARFAQPAVILWTANDAVQRRLQRALGEAVGTMVQETLPLMADGWSSADLWQRAFAETYRTELRAERNDQAERLYRAFAARYDRATEALCGSIGAAASAAARKRASSRWQRRRIVGKLLSVLRLFKASFPFEDGAAYLAWKIRRHSGVTVELTPWQRRHPVLAASVLAWRLYRSGGFR
jgi:predicted nucleotidyltransferase